MAISPNDLMSSVLAEYSDVLSREEVEFITTLAVGLLSVNVWVNPEFRGVCAIMFSALCTSTEDMFAAISPAKKIAFTSAFTRSITIFKGSMKAARGSI